MRDSVGTLLSDNTYWLAADDSQYRRLNQLASVKLIATATARAEAEEIIIDLKLTNPAEMPALATKAVLLNSRSGLPLLPAYFSDNYVTLLPKETRTLTIHYPRQTNPAAPSIALRGWNIDPILIAVSSPK